MKKYLVIGGSGFIGRKLVDKLCLENEVIVADIVAADEYADKKNVTYIPLNFIHAESFAPYLEGVDTVIHLVCTLLPSDGTDGLYDDILKNVAPTIRLLDDMVAMGNIRLVFLSSGGTIYGEGNDTPSRESDPQHPFCKYALIKTMTEKTIELYRNQHGLDATIVRFSNPYGFIPNCNRTQGLVPVAVNRFLSNEKLVIWGQGENIRDFIFIDDAIDGLLAVLAYKGNMKEFNIGSGIGLSINEVLQLISMRLNLEKPPVDYSAARICDLDSNVLDISKITRYTGWRPHTDINTGIDLVIQEFLSRDEK